MLPLGRRRLREASLGHLPSAASQVQDADHTVGVTDFEVILREQLVDNKTGCMSSCFGASPRGTSSAPFFKWTMLTKLMSNFFRDSACQTSVGSPS